MNDVMLPWPERRRPGADSGERPGRNAGRRTAKNTGAGGGSGAPGSGSDQPAPAAPHFEIQRMDGADEGDTAAPAEVLPVTRPPWAAQAARRGIVGVGIASSVAAALLLSGCDEEHPHSPSSSPTPTDSDSWSPTPTDTDTPDPTDFDPTPWSEPPTDDPATSPYPDPGTTSSDPTYGSGGTTTSGGSTGGGTICTCNKVCTCIPVCQAHELLNPDPVVRRMAETVVVAMGLRQLPYLRWAAREAPAPLRSRIDELVGELRGGRQLTPDDLTDPGCAPYLTSRNPVIAMMAAQVLALRALRGAGLTGTLAQRAADALTAGHALHVRRAPAWAD